ncbi:hypothetical protein ACJX0J_023952, partial [Zea mays]
FMDCMQEEYERTTHCIHSYFGVSGGLHADWHLALWVTFEYAIDYARLPIYTYACVNINLVSSISFLQANFHSTLIYAHELLYAGVGNLQM